MYFIVHNDFLGHLSDKPVLRPDGLELQTLADISLPICCRRVHWRLGARRRAEGDRGTEARLHRD